MIKITRIALLSVVFVSALSLKARAEVGLSMLAPLFSMGSYAVAQSTNVCVSNGSCSAPTPACGQTTTGIDNCGAQCFRTGAACQVATSIGLSANPPAVNRSATSAITAVVRDQNGAAMSGAGVSFSLTGGPGSVSPGSGVSNSLGQASATFFAPANFAGKSVQSTVRSCLSNGACADVSITTNK